MSTGVKVWQVCVDGQIYLSAWANIGIRWISTNTSNTNANLGGIELYINGDLVGVSKLELNQNLDGTGNFMQASWVTSKRNFEHGNFAIFFFNFRIRRVLLPDHSL